MTVNAEARMWHVDDPNEIVRCRSPQQKPFVRVRFPTGETVEISFALAEWIGTEAKALRERHELLVGRSHAPRKYKPRENHAEAPEA